MKKMSKEKKVLVAVLVLVLGLIGECVRLELRKDDREGELDELMRVSMKTAGEKGLSPPNPY